METRAESFDKNYVSGGGSGVINGGGGNDGKI